MRPAAAVFRSSGNIRKTTIFVNYYFFDRPGRPFASLTARSRAGIHPNRDQPWSGCERAKAPSVDDASQKPASDGRSLLQRVTVFFSRLSVIRTADLQPGAWTGRLTHAHAGTVASFVVAGVKPQQAPATSEPL